MMTVQAHEHELEEPLERTIATDSDKDGAAVQSGATGRSGPHNPPPVRRLLRLLLDRSLYAPPDL